MKLKKTIKTLFDTYKYYMLFLGIIFTIITAILIVFAIEPKNRPFIYQIR